MNGVRLVAALSAVLPNRPLLLFISLLLSGCCLWRIAPSSGVAQAVLIPSGKFTPFYFARSAADNDSVRALLGTPVDIQSFYLDKTLVTYSDYRKFVTTNPNWRRSEVAKLFADINYLKDWTPLNTFPVGLQNTPIANVSWFAAMAYCRWVGGRLPSTLEWEYVGAASERSPDASHDQVFIAQVLAAYVDTDNAHSKVVLNRPPNYYGVSDMHSIVWEWTSDFNSVFLSGDNREDGEVLKNSFCGAGSLSIEDRANYAAFLRYAMRNSLQGDFTTQNLGFRCAYDGNS